MPIPIVTTNPTDQTHENRPETARTANLAKNTAPIGFVTENATLCNRVRGFRLVQRNERSI